MCLGGKLHGHCCNKKGDIIKADVIVPLTGATATVTIVDFVAQVVIKQRYENKEEDPIEAVYEFPLDSNAAVCSFIAEIDGKKVVGKVKEKEEAREIYDDAIAEGHGAYLLEEKKPNLFEASVGNLPPKKEVLISITYVTELFFDENKLRFVLPTTSYPPNGVGTFQKFAPSSLETYNKEVPYGLKIEVNFDMSSNIKSVSSPTHPVQFEFGNTPNKAKVQLANSDGTPLVKDLELQVTLAEPHKSCARIQIDEATKNKVAMVSLFPEMNEEEVFSEIIFVVDRSGSMAGSKIEQVKQTLEIFLRSLPEGTLFNIVGFGTHFEKLFDNGSVEYNDKNLEIANQHVKQMNANFGGTNIIAPLMSIFQEKPKNGIPRQIFLLTDGEVTNPQKCIDAVRKHADTTRVFTFGIGNDADKNLVRGMAEAGEGKAEFILSGENMDEKVLRQLKRALKPALTDIKMDWGSLKNVEQTPFHLPPLFSGGRLVVYAFVPKDTKGETIVTLSAATAKGPFSTSVKVNFAETVDGDFICKLAAKSLIRDLEEGRSYLHDNKGNLLTAKTDVKKRIIELSVKHSLMSKYTSFVAVEKRKDAVQKEMKLRRIAPASTQPRLMATASLAPPSSMPSSSQSRSGGGSGPMKKKLKAKSKKEKEKVGHVSRSSPPPAPIPASPPAPPPASPPASPLQSGTDKAHTSQLVVESSARLPAAPPLPHAVMALPSLSAPPPQKEEAEELLATTGVSSAESDAVRNLIKQQSANGSFNLAALQSQLPKVTVDTIRQLLKESNVAVNEKTELILITVIVTLIFALKYGNQKTLWDLVVTKAKSWVKKESSKEKIKSDINLEDVAKKFLAQHGITA
jgi:uncharacterized protein YegL